MWAKLVERETDEIVFMPRTLDPLDPNYNQYDNVVIDEEEFVEVPIQLDNKPKE